MTRHSKKKCVERSKNLKEIIKNVSKWFDEDFFVTFKIKNRGRHVSLVSIHTKDFEDSDEMEDFDLEDLNELAGDIAEKVPHSNALKKEKKDEQEYIG